MMRMMKTRFDSQLSRMNSQTFIELGALGRQRDDADVGGHLELAGRVPIHQDNGMGTRRDGKGYFGEVQGHGFGIAEG
jgi:hypothetical protein